MRHPVNPSAPASRRVAQGIVFTNDRTARHSKWSGLVSGITWPFVMFRLNSTRFSSYTRYTCYLLISRPNTIEVNDYLPTIGKWSRHPSKIESSVVSSHSPEESFFHERLWNLSNYPSACVHIGADANSLLLLALLSALDNTKLHRL